MKKGTLGSHVIFRKLPFIASYSDKLEVTNEMVSGRNLSWLKNVYGVSDSESSKDFGGSNGKPLYISSVPSLTILYAGIGPVVMTCRDEALNIAAATKFRAYLENANFVPHLDVVWCLRGLHGEYANPLH